MIVRYVRPVQHVHARIDDDGSSTPPAGASEGSAAVGLVRSVARWVRAHPRQTAALGLGIATIGVTGPVRAARAAVIAARFAVAAAPVALAIIEAATGRDEAARHRDD